VKPTKDPRWQHYQMQVSTGVFRSIRVWLSDLPFSVALWDWWRDGVEPGAAVAHIVAAFRQHETR